MAKWISLLLALMMAGCSAPTAEPAATPLATVTQQFVMPTPIPTLTYTPDPRVTPSLTPSLVPSATPRPQKPFTSLSLERMPGELRLYQRVELNLLTDGQAGNPFDPAQVDLRVMFRGPSGQQVEVPAFYYQEFDRQSLQPAGQPAWRVRFTPSEAGEWQAQAYLVQGGLQSQALMLQVAPDDSARGFVRIHASNPAYFQYEDGSFYFPVGINMGWAGSDVLGDYERWLDRFSANGGNLVRVWMASWSFGLEWNDTGLGDYSDRMLRAWLLDQVFRMAEERGVTIMLCLINHGAFSATVNPEWDSNPYNAVLGGPLQSPEAFVSDPVARDLFKRRLRYIAARWSYSTSLFAWEWWNEIQWTPIATDQLRPWLSEMTATLRSLDPYQHLVTHSTSTNDSIWTAPELQIMQIHDYSRSFLPDVLPAFHQLKQYVTPAKPLLLGEFGTDANGEQGAFQAQAIHLHTGLWAAPFAGYAGTGMYWWWDNYIDPNDHWVQFQPVARFFKGEDLALYRPGKAQVSGDAVALTLQQPDRALLWVVNRAYSIATSARAYTAALLEKKVDKNAAWVYEPPLLEDVQVTVRGLADGRYSVRWYDPQSGAWLDETTLETRQGSLSLSIPALRSDLAAKIMLQK
jgi:hypothetical protein